MQKHLSPRQFAEAIGVSESSVRRWADDGQIQITRTGGGHGKIARTEAIRFIRATSAEVVRPDLLQISEPPHRHQRAAAFGAQHDELLKAPRKGDREVVLGLLTRMYAIGDGRLREITARRITHAANLTVAGACLCQQWRGVAAHFNRSTAFDAMVLSWIEWLMVFATIVIAEVARFFLANPGDY